MMRYWTPKQTAAPEKSPLAVAIPTKNHKAAFDNVLSEIESWDCVIQGKLHDASFAAPIGESIGELSLNWFKQTLPQSTEKALQLVQSPRSNDLELALVSPQFLIYRTASGNEVAIPIKQARNFQASASRFKRVRRCRLSLSSCSKPPIRG